MTPNLGGWIHSFTVTDTLTHKRGYTIYKITSIVFPRSVPQALTCITVWKRFHDIKRLHRELCRRQKILQINGHIPEPTDCSFFKRFDPGVILKRKEYILQLLDFAAQHPALYKCHAFIQFFCDGQSPDSSPMHHLIPGSLCSGDNEGEGKSAIAEICDSLDLRYDHDNLSLLDPQRDDNEADRDKSAVETLKAKPNQSIAGLVNGNDSEALTENVGEKQKPCKDYSRFLTPMASIESEDSDYIYEAALEFSKAVQAEVNLEYKEAHTRYKSGIELLLNGSKGDSNEERKFIAKTKISKYLSRADDIYEKFLSEESEDNANRSNFQLSIDVTDGNSSQCGALYLEHPWNSLTKYKVLKILGDRVMQVQSITEPNRPTYIMKGIEKPSSNSPTQTVFLPQCVPYMVDLVAFFQSDQKVFLLLKQANGGRLYDYMLSYSPNITKSTSLNQIFPDVEDVDASDSSNMSVQDSGFVDESTASNKQSTPTEQTEFAEIVRCSQQLIESVSSTLKESEEREDTTLLQQTQHQANECVQIAQHSINQRLPEACLKQWARELAVAIHSLHTKGVILCDLHMENLLLGAKGQLMLTYFYQNEGLSCDNYMHKVFSPLALAGHYVAPERPLTTKSDWWSYGIILYHLLLGLSFKAAHPGHIDLYGCVQYPEPADISDSARDLLDNLLQTMPEDRLDYEQIQNHAFFEGTDWDEVLRNGFKK